VSFRLGSIPVRVRAYFFLMAVMLGAQNRSPQLIALWIGVVFVSVLIHELGHALIGRAFGLAPQIELHGMGGTTSWIGGREKLGPGRSIAISLAGPFAGFLFGTLVFVVAKLLPHTPSPMVAVAIEQLLWVNIGWGIINLLPMMPLDGGNVARSTLDWLTKGNGEKPARILSIVLAGLLLLWAAINKQLWMGFLGAMFTWSNVQAFRQIDQRRVDLPLAEAIEKSYAALDRQDGAAAVNLLRPVLVPNASIELRQIALRLFAYGLLLEGQWPELLPLLDKERDLIGLEELGRYAKAARELGRADAAAEVDRIRMAITPAA